MNGVLGQVQPEVLVAVAAAVAGTGVLVAALGFRGAVAGPSSRPGWRRRAVAGSSRRVLLGVGAGVLTLVLTRWVVAGIGIGLLVACWQRLLGGNAEENRGIARLEGLANWTESLRDTIAGAIGLEQAIPATAATSAPVLRPSLNLLVDRLRVREPLPDALLRFADDVDDPSADVVVAALVLNARLRGPGLRDVLTALAASTREELDVRRRIEASRRSIRRSVQIVLLIVLGVMGVLSVFNRSYVAPYSTFSGQVALIVVAGLLVLGLTWLRRLARVEAHERFLSRPAGGAA
ncbi:type II secretion system F family protein [Kineococcus radiotolerans]|uniref:Type II secretion system protein n=1 Tax=Kineococcus radiotolerans (strain ATCC BAA-149 / DSM 14245 / SRS30216) TaxID=266940 RepID=A6WCQ8_KINRD|nr:type II secretion system F family protein [Kineococcus radiotolerans]ABS04597.1 type II secretion system protein [Kineococcus radiotolerans SRS30216 = ATCC BAA-149]